jgi:acetyl esterase/lipase
MPFVTQAASPSQPPPHTGGIPDGVEIEEVVTGTGGGRSLHAEIARLKDPPKVPRPAVLFIHGGSWSARSHKESWSGDPDPRTFEWLFLASHGYFVASIEYRLSGEAKWPAQIEDCKLGVRWMRANASKYNVDPGRIACWGGSAGAHLAACLGTMDQPEYEGHGGHEGVSSRVQAVIDYCGPVDFTSGTFANGSTTIPEENKAKVVAMLNALFGATFAEKPELWMAASPITHVRPGHPPFLIVHGERDEVVSLAQATTFAATLRRAGVPVELQIVKGLGHDFEPIWQGWPNAPVTDPTATGLRAEIVDFLERSLKAPAARAGR